MDYTTYPNTNNGRTLLVWVADEECEDEMKLLLERGDINPNTPDTKYGLTPLEWGAQHRDDRVVKLLLEREVSTPTVETRKVAERHSGGLRREGTRE